MTALYEVVPGAVMQAEDVNQLVRRLNEEGLYVVRSHPLVGLGQDDTTALQDQFDEADEAATGGGYTGARAILPSGTRTCLITSPLHLKQAQLYGTMRSTKIFADPSFSGGSHMIRNWAASDYGPDETDTTVPPATCANPTYFHQIDGIHLQLGAVAGLRGIGLLHPHETSYIRNVSMSNPGPTGGVGIDISVNDDFQGTVNGLVDLTNIVMYGGANNWLHELLAGDGGGSLKVDLWTTNPGAHLGSVFDLSLFDVEISRLHCEGYVDLTSVDADLATIRFRGCVAAAVNNSFWTNTGVRTYKHPFIYASNDDGSGFNRTMAARNLTLNLGGTYDAAVPLIHDHSQSVNPVHIFYDQAQTRIDYTGNVYDFIKGSTGIGRWRTIGDAGAIAGGYSASMTPNMAQFKYHQIIVTDGNAFTLNAPINPFTGDELWFDFSNTSGGPCGAITLNATYHAEGTFTGPANGKRKMLAFYYAGGSWVEIHRSAADLT